MLHGHLGDRKTNGRNRDADAASTPTYKEKHMAITTIQPGGFYDINRDMYNGMTASEAYEREMHYRRHQEAEYRRMQNSYFAPEQKPVNPTPKRDAKDPLAFLTKTDNKILLTGEAL